MQAGGGLGKWLEERCKKERLSLGQAATRTGLSHAIIGSIIRDATGKAVAAISISIPVFRMNQASRERLATLVRRGASLISYRLGYRDPVNPIGDIREIRLWWEQNQKETKEAKLVCRRALPGETGADGLELVPLPLQPRA